MLRITARGGVVLNVSPTNAEIPDIEALIAALEGLK